MQISEGRERLFSLLLKPDFFFISMSKNLKACIFRRLVGLFSWACSGPGRIEQIFHDKILPKRSAGVEIFRGRLKAPNLSSRRTDSPDIRPKKHAYHRTDKDVSPFDLLHGKNGRLKIMHSWSAGPAPLQGRPRREPGHRERKPHRCEAPAAGSTTKGNRKKRSNTK